MSKLQITSAEKVNLGDSSEVDQKCRFTFRSPSSAVQEDIPKNAVTISTLEDFFKGGTQIRTGGK